MKKEANRSELKLSAENDIDLEYLNSLTQGSGVSGIRPMYTVKVQTDIPTTHMLLTVSSGDNDGPHE